MNQYDDYMSFQSTKVIELGSCAFRQWRAKDSHCSQLHGYQLVAKLWFGCNTLDDKNWCTDFGNFKELKVILNSQFDHTTCVAQDDPHIEKFHELHRLNVIDLRVMESVGAERTAEWVFNTASEFVNTVYGDRCWVEKVEVFEHANNSAIFEKQTQVLNLGLPKDEGFIPLIETPEQVSTEPAVSPTSEPPYNPSRAAPVGRTSTPGLGGLYDGTIWGR